MRTGTRHKATGNSKKKCFCFVLGAMLFALSLPVEAQQPAKIPRVGFLFPGTRNSTLYEAFQQGLRELGYVEGQNIAVQYRYADGDNSKLRGVAAELVNLKVDLLVAGGGNDVTLALQHATKSIPIVMTAGSYPVSSGIVVSLAKPGGNVTGQTALWGDLSGKRLELLKETVPKLSRVAVLWQSSGGRGTQWKESQSAGQQLGLQLYSMEVRSGDDLENASSKH